VGAATPTVATRSEKLIDHGDSKKATRCTALAKVSEVKFALATTE